MKKLILALGVTVLLTGCNFGSVAESIDTASDMIVEVKDATAELKELNCELSEEKTEECIKLLEKSTKENQL